MTIYMCSRSVIGDGLDRAAPAMSSNRMLKMPRFGGKGNSPVLGRTGLRKSRGGQVVDDERVATNSDSLVG
jgi:hypothetical protein